MVYWLSFCVIFFAGAGGLTFLLVRLIRNPTSPPIIENLLLIALSVFIAFMGLELYFKLFFAQSDAVFTLAARNWRDWYHPPEAFNSLGYRDREWTEEMVAGKTKVMVVGDSFVQGVNIRHPEDRFSNLLAGKLGDDFVVFNLGQGGANTQDEIQAMITYPHRPDILIFSYFINDIEGEASWQRGFERPAREGVPEWLAPVVNHSYAWNFLYWRAVRFDIFVNDQPDIEADPYWVWFRSLYENPDIWWLHQKDLLSIYEGAQAEQLPLIVVVFPSLTYIEETEFITARVIRLFEERGVPTIDVAELVKDIPTPDLLASPVDPHPSERVHRLVAEALYEQMVELELVE